MLTLGYYSGPLSLGLWSQRRRPAITKRCLTTANSLWVIEFRFHEWWCREFPCKARPKPKSKAFPKPNAEFKRTPRQPSHSPPPERVAPWKRKKKIDEEEKEEKKEETETEKKEEPEQEDKQNQEQKTTEEEPAAPSSSSSGVVYHGVTDAVMKLGEWIIISRLKSKCWQICTVVLPVWWSLWWCKLWPRQEIMEDAKISPSVGSALSTVHPIDQACILSLGCQVLL